MLQRALIASGACCALRSAVRCEATCYHTLGPSIASGMRTVGPLPAAARQVSLYTQHYVHTRNCCKLNAAAVKQCCGRSPLPPVAGSSSSSRSRLAVVAAAAADAVVADGDAAAADGAEEPLYHRRRLRKSSRSARHTQTLSAAPAVARAADTTAAAATAAAESAAPQQAASSSSSSASKGATATASRAKAAGRARSRRSTSSGSSNGHGSSSSSRDMVQGPHVTVPQPLPHVLILHTGGTLGMNVKESFDVDPEDPHHLQIKKGTGGIYGGLEPGAMLANLFQQVPELCQFANLDLQVVFNKDSSRVGPKEWVQIAKILDKNRQSYDAFLVVHGTDTLAYTASALSLMLQGFRKPIVLTGSQLPLASPRSDARQNLIDALTCATAAYTPPHMALNEVAVCFGGKLMRGNRAQKVNSSNYQAFDSPTYPHLAALGVDVEWNERYLLRVEGGYRPRFNLEPSVIRIPIVPGSDPRTAYGDLAERGVKGVVLEAFGVGNMPDLPQQGWMPWLRQQTKKGLQVYLASQCHLGPLNPELYRSGAMAAQMGVEAGPQMTPECAVVKMMLCLSYPDIPLGLPLAGEL